MTGRHTSITANIEIPPFFGRNNTKVFDHLEAQKPLVECFNPVDNTYPILPVCRLKGILSEAQQAFRNTLDRYTLADLLKNPEELRFYLG